MENQPTSPANANTAAPPIPAGVAGPEGRQGLEYASLATPCHRPAVPGLAALLLSLAALAPALLALLVGSGGRYLAPFALIVLGPIWAISLVLGVAGTIALLGTQFRSGRWSNLRCAATLANLVFWLALGASILGLILRM